MNSVTDLPALRRAQWLLSVRALEQVLQADRPADAVLQQLFRENRQCGSRDRALVTDLVYRVLRGLRRLQAQVHAGDTASPAQLAAAELIGHGFDAAQLRAWGLDEADDLAARLQVFDPGTLSEAQRGNVPDDIYARWCLQYGEDGARQLAASLNREATVDLRVNWLRADREQARQRLAGEGLPAEPTPLSPLGLRLLRRAPLQNSAAFREGWLEPQDEGSQLIALLVAARPGETIVDFCAGAGGKTLALGAQLQGAGELVACDISAARLQRLTPRLQRMGLGGVRMQPLRDEHDAAMDRYVGKADAVLVDAPCSGTGTWRRNPELRLQQPDWAVLQTQQLSILQSASRLLRPGGRLVYATCSLMAEENDEVLQRFLSSNPSFVLQSARALLQPQGVPYEGEVLRLLPHRHGTDGFYAAALRRIG
jgi:16S rRNA (cytosine967-C5)-methyltransferase